MPNPENDDLELEDFWRSLTYDQQQQIRRKQELADEQGFELVLHDIEDLRRLLD